MDTHKINTHGILTIKNNPLRDKPQHTPTPWFTRNNEIFSENEPESIVSVNFTTNPDERGANASFIVKAVNSFGLIVEALSDILESKTLLEAKEYAEKTLRNVQDREND